MSRKHWVIYQFKVTFLPEQAHSGINKPMAARVSYISPFIVFFEVELSSQQTQEVNSGIMLGHNISTYSGVFLRGGGGLVSSFNITCRYFPSCFPG